MQIMRNGSIGNSLLLLIVLTFSVFAQYGNNLVSNGNMETGDPPTGWNDNVNSATVTAELTEVYEGSQSLKLANSGSGGGTYQLISVSAETDYRVISYFKTSVSSHDNPIYDHTNSAWILAPSFSVYAAWAAKTKNFTTPSGCTQIRLYCRGNSATAVGYFDAVIARQKLDTLWVSSSGDNADADTVQTLAESFENRGAHTDGVFVVLAGTYSESITIDASFSKILFVGNPTFTEIDANSKTFTVDGCYTGSFVNDDNVTYTNPCSSTETADGKFKGNGGWNRFKGF